MGRVIGSDVSGPWSPADLIVKKTRQRREQEKDRQDKRKKRGRGNIVCVREEMVKHKSVR